MDLAEIGLEESKKPLRAEVDLLIEGAGEGADTTCDAIVGYFDVSFRGGKGKARPLPLPPRRDPTGAPATEPIITLSTEPCAEGATHWGQQVFPLSPPLPVRAGTGSGAPSRCGGASDNPRLLEVELDVRVVEGPRRGPSPPTGR